MVGLTALPKNRQRGCYEQIIGGRLREVRSNVTRPADETNLAVVGLVTMRLPSWKGLPQPAGEFPLPSDNGCVARQNVPSIFAHSMPQCVYSRYGRPASSRVVVVDEPVCEPHAATDMAAPTRARRRIVICSHYERTASSSHLAGDQHHLLGPALALIDFRQLRCGRAQALGSGHSGQTSAPDGVAPRRRAAGSGIGSTVIGVGSRSLAAIVTTRSLWRRTATH